MFRFPQEPSSGSRSQCLAKITGMVLLCLSIWCQCYGGICRSLIATRGLSDYQKIIGLRPAVLKIIFTSIPAYVIYVNISSCFHINNNKTQLHHYFLSLP